MTDISSALWAFWSQFELDGVPIPAYQAGGVPDGVALPYVIFSPTQGNAFSTLPMTAYFWTRHDGVNTAPAIAQRTAFAEAVSRAIPYGGIKLQLDEGFVVLDRGSGDFLSTMSDPEDRNAIATRVGYEIRYYTT